MPPFESPLKKASQDFKPISPDVLALRWVTKALEAGQSISAKSSDHEIALLGIAIQRAQRMLGTENSPKNIVPLLRGEFNDELRGALKEVQTALKIPLTGFADKKTLEALQKALSNNEIPSTSGETQKYARLPIERNLALDSNSLPAVSRSSFRFSNSALELPTPKSRMPQVDPNIGQMPGPERNKIAKDGLADFSRLNRAYAASLDRNNDGVLTRDELNYASRDPRISGEKAQYVAALMHSYDKLQAVNGSKTGLSISNLNALSSKVESFYARKMPFSGFSNTEADAVKSLHSTLLNSAETLIARTDKLYVNGPKSISSKQIEQGMIGNCYLHVALGLVADKDPKAIEKMIQPLGNGSYLVTFPGAPDKAQMVTAPTDTELALYGNSGKSGLWAAVIQKAFGQYLQHNSRDPLHSFGDYKNSYGASDNGGATGEAVQLLTGKAPQFFFINGHIPGGISTSELEKQLLKSNSPNVYVAVGSVYPTEAIAKDSKKMEGIVDNHAYQVLAYDSQTKMVKLRNPWGSGEWSPRPDRSPVDGKNDGVFQLPLAEFEKRFSDITVNS
jgi:hypothetical protein